MPKDEYRELVYAERVQRGDTPDVAEEAAKVAVEAWEPWYERREQHAERKATPEEVAAGKKGIQRYKYYAYKLPEGVRFMRTHASPLAAPTPPPVTKRQQKNGTRNTAKVRTMRQEAAQWRAFVAQCPHCGSTEVAGVRVTCRTCGCFYEADSVPCQPPTPPGPVDGDSPSTGPTETTAAVGGGRDW